MASVPIRSTAVVAAPKDYAIPPSQEIILLSVTASFVDNGAAGDWLPAVVILDQNGNALVRAVDQGVKVTAGSDAEVSWFPGVKNASTSGGGVVAWATVTNGGSPQAVTPDPITGNTTPLTMSGATFVDDGSGTFTFDPLAPTYIQTTVVPAAGIWIVRGYFQHDNSIATAITFSDVRGDLPADSPIGSGSLNVGSVVLQSSDEGIPGAVNDEFAWALMNLYAADGDPTPIGFQVTAANYNASNQNLNVGFASLMVALVAA